MSRKDDLHYRALINIVRFSDELPLGFPRRKVILSSIEPLLTDSSGRAVACPDVLFEVRRDSKNREFHIVEFKGDKGNGELYDLAMKQLAESAWWCGKFHPEVQRVYSHLLDGNDPLYREIYRRRIK